MTAKLIALAISVASLGCAHETRSIAASDTPVAVVSQLYRDYAWEVVFRDGHSWPSLFDAPREALVKYFDDSLTVLVERDQKCRERTNAPCNLSSAPIWDSNDPQALDLSVVVAADSTEVVVSFRRLYPPPDGEVVKLLYRMVKTPRGWRVRDIVRSDGGSLVQSLNARSRARPASP